MMLEEDLLGVIMGMEGGSNGLAHMRRYAEAGLPLQWLCSPRCDGRNHGRNGHPPEGAGKIPTLAGWQRLGARTAEVLEEGYSEGLNLSILTGWHDSARLCVVAVDGDDEAALAWMREYLPPTRVKSLTRRGEHWFYRCVAPTAKRNLKFSPLALSIDLMADGGQVVAPPSVHRDGHVYEEIEPWTPEALASMPVFNPAWFEVSEGVGSKSASSSAGSSASAPFEEPRGTWPGKRVFSEGDLREAVERAIMYLERCPVSRAGHGGDAVLHDVTVKLLRGFPLASMARTRLAPVTVDARDAQGAAYELLRERWNPRCVDADGETPYPWDDDRLRYKVSEAAAASRLPGPDYWLFDDADQRARYAERFGTIGSMHDRTATGEEKAADGEKGAAANEGRTGGEPAGEPEVKAAAKGAFESLDEAFPVNKKTGKITIRVDWDLKRMKKGAIYALARLGRFYIHRGQLADMVIPDPHDLDKHGLPKRPHMRRTSKQDLVCELSSEVEWIEEEMRRGADEPEQVRKRADLQTVSAVLSDGVWHEIPPLDGIIYVPTVRKDGSILQTPGYDSATDLYYHPTIDVGHIEANPTQEDVRAAVASLMYVLSDFKFDNGFDPSHARVARSVWLSAVLTRFCRHVHPMKTPMFAVNARENGSGKSLLANCAAIISDGRAADTVNYNGDEAESKREIIAYLAEDETHTLCLDNLKVRLESVTYEQLLTGPTQIGRVVGSSEVRRITMSDAVWWANGNGLRIGLDMSRRVLLISICEPNRSYKQQDLLGYCRDSRPQLVRACLTILAGFAASGGLPQDRDCDGVKMERFESFEAWDRVVRQAVVWAGLPDPLRALANKDAGVADEKEKSAYLIKTWYGAFGTAEKRVGGVVAELRDKPSQYRELAAFLLEHGLEKLTPVALGRFLSENSHQGSWTDEHGHKFRMLHRRRGDGTYCWVQEVK